MIKHFPVCIALMLVVVVGLFRLQANALRLRRTARVCA